MCWESNPGLTEVRQLISLPKFSERRCQILPMFTYYEYFKVVGKYRFNSLTPLELMLLAIFSLRKNGSFSAFTDRFTNKKDTKVNVNEFYRILILPWPAYTDAFRIGRLDPHLYKGGNLIEGTSIELYNRNNYLPAYFILRSTLSFSIPSQKA